MTSRRVLPNDAATRVMFLRTLVHELAVIANQLPVLPLDHLDGEDLLSTTTINRHTSAAHAALCMATEEAANFLESVRDHAQRRVFVTDEVKPRCVDCRAASNGEFASQQKRPPTFWSRCATTHSGACS